MNAPQLDLLGPGGVRGAEIRSEMDSAERQAWNALGRYKFWMFGYFAARWVYLNQLSREKRPNPFKDLVVVARARGRP